MATLLERATSLLAPDPSRQSREARHAEQALLDRLDELADEAQTAKDRWVTTEDQARDLRLYREGGQPKNPAAMFYRQNFIRAFIDRMVAQLTDNRPIIRVEPRKAGIRGVARATTKVVSSLWDDSHMQRKTYGMAHNAAISRSAGLYMGYDPVSDDIVPEVLGIDQVLIDPMVSDASKLGEAEYVIIERARPLEDLRYRFPARAADLKPDVSVTESPEESKRRGMRGPLTDIIRGGRSGKMDALGRVKVWECLVRDRTCDAQGRALFPYGRMVLRTKDRVLWDGPLPFWDGTWPLDWFDWTVDPEHPWGISEPATLMYMQLAFNQLVNGTVENAILTNFITTIGDWDALADETQWKKLQSITNSLVLRKRNRNATFAIQPPAPFGADRIQLARFIFTQAQLMTGVTDVTLGETPGSLQSGQAIEGLQEGANLMTRSRASRMEDFYVRAGAKLVARILQFRTGDQIVSAIGPTGEAVEYAIQRQEFFTDDQGQPIDPQVRRDVFRFLRFSVAPGSSAPGSRVNRGRMALNLHLAGLVPGSMVLQASDYPNAEEVYAQAQKEMQGKDPEVIKRMQAMAMKNG